MPDIALSAKVPLCLGAAPFGALVDRPTAFAILDAFAAAGGTMVDTAHVYSNWLPRKERCASEKTIGRWLAANPGTKIRVQTKGGHHDPEARTIPRLGREAVLSDLHASLGNLGLDRIELYFLHRDDPTLPAAEILETVVMAQRSGLIAAYGLSNWSRARWDEALAACTRNGWPGPVASQVEWNLARRNPGSIDNGLVRLDGDFYDWHRRNQLLLMPYSAQARGYFDLDALGAGPARDAVLADFDNPGSRAIRDRLVQMGRDLGASPTATSLSLMLLAPFPVMPVIGPTTVQQVQDSLSALRLRPGQHPLAGDLWRLATGQDLPPARAQSRKWFGKAMAMARMSVVTFLR